MSPVPKDEPAGSTETTVCVDITSAIRADLRVPVRRIGLDLMTVLRAGVPEASIDEDRHPAPGEDQIRSAWQRLKWPGMNSVPQAGTVNESPDRNLGASVARADGSHVGAPRRGGHDGDWINHILTLGPMPRHDPMDGGLR